MKTKTKLSKLKGQSLSPGASAPSSISAAIKFIQVDSFKIAHKVIGKGKPIIFLARFRGTLNDWDAAFVDAVAKSYKVILFDAHGVGLSTGIVPTSVTKWADQAVQFTRALGIDHAIYLGWSKRVLNVDGAIIAPAKAARIFSRSPRYSRVNIVVRSSAMFCGSPSSTNGLTPENAKIGPCARTST